ncbi:MAG: Holliday junction resolvase [Chloroflexi bacterium RBG_16_60_22]|nr:MAG: Holliday junction resolvase [Chloroflexi bacterium RBG_16_60_22]
MEVVAAIAVIAIIAVIIIVLSHYITRLKYEKRFRDWQEAEISRWSVEMQQARKAAVTQSRAVLGGQFTEQMVPFFPDFRYDPTEVRFIGSPIDMIVFPGLARGDPEEIVILEVKTGSGTLTPPQRKIRQLVEDGMVRWEELYRAAAGESGAT